MTDKPIGSQEKECIASLQPMSTHRNIKRSHNGRQPKRYNYFPFPPLSKRWSQNLLLRSSKTEKDKTEEIRKDVGRRKRQRRCCPGTQENDSQASLQGH
jgi:hypothetical protein